MTKAKNRSRRIPSLAGLVVLLCACAAAGRAQENGECLACHAEKTFSIERNGKAVSLFADESQLKASVHADAPCVACHADLAGQELPHAQRPARAQCGTCHSSHEEQFNESLHGKALSRGDPLAPRCQSCHGSHGIAPTKNSLSAVAPMRVPYVCGSCHSEGAPAQKQRPIHQDHIIENYSESIHGEGLLKKGLSVSATCTSCHSSHHILPHTDPRSSISRANISKTCMKCHAQIEAVHRKVINGELWQKKPHMIPACVECHQPHKVRKVFYNQGMADKDCLRCHAQEGMGSELGGSVHGKTACAQCHTEVAPSKVRPCETIVNKVNCSICHSAQMDQYQTSVHGKLFKKGDPNAPTCIECHGKHGVLSRKDTRSATFSINVPNLCARCHQEGKKAAVRYAGKEREIPQHYVESIHGKGLLKSGLVVTAMCTSCHTAHGERPAGDPASSVHRDNIALTCSQCHFGVYEKYVGSVHSPKAT
ncbi:MAG: hypothetical protein HY548_09115, partial [Elusimicrobia bacterium]|nr:hypothetical protein [Elusimicrobiota bacterium]